MESSFADRLARVARKSTCRLTHYGRKSGRPYEVTIWFLVDGDTVYLTTMNMQRQWTRNVQAHPKVLLRIGGDAFSGDIEVVTDPAQMPRVVELLRKKYWLARPYLWLKGKPDGAFRVHLRP
ncbi:MAG: nitroreductase family deazaflavin-dependent oxidoreductase [Candidatus Methylomirabilia bacterium]